MTSAALTPKTTRWIVAASLLLAGAYAVIRLARVWANDGHPMDDAYMFYRYAMNLRHGLGMSWNPDGSHTYGETAPLWGMVVVLLSFLPLSVTHTLMLGSWLFAGAAIVAMAWAVSRNAQSELMKSLWRVLPMIAVPLIVTRTYWPNALTGMETMLAVGLAAVFLGFAIGWVNGVFRPEWAAGVGLVLFLTRPESALAVILFAVIAGVSGRARWSKVARFVGVFAAGIAADLLICKMYFHTALPLSFYMKSQHAYEGYHMTWQPLTHAIEMLGDCSLFVLVMLLFTRKTERGLVAMCVVPALATFCYLVTVTQIMGDSGRYYAPYFAFFIVPALLVLDSRLDSPERDGDLADLKRRTIALGAAAVVAVCAVLAVGVHRTHESLRAADRAIEARPFLYEDVRCEKTAAAELPIWDRNVRDVAEYFVAPLPAGVTIAASEVGYVGVANPAATVIDLEGLNDTQIALHGFKVEELIARKPDVIWMPHRDYTYQRGILLSHPLLLAQYDLFVGAGGYGMAVRKDSAMREAILRQMRVFWDKFYPGYSMSDYVARSVSWSGVKYRPVGY